MTKKYTADVVERDGEFYMVFPMEVLNELGWKENDTVIWDVNPKTKEISLRKIENNE